MATDLYVSLSWEGIRNATSLPADQLDTPEVMLGRRRLQDYIFCGPEELFDLKNDPEELNNLAGKTVFESVLKETRAKIEDWQY